MVVTLITLEVNTCVVIMTRSWCCVLLLREWDHNVFIKSLDGLLRGNYDATCLIDRGEVYISRQIKPAIQDLERSGVTYS